MRTIITLFIPLLLIGCASSTAGRADRGETGNVPSDLVIEFGEGGGVTGLWSGFTLQADGNVEEWSGRAAGENRTQKGRLSSSAVKEIWERLQKLELLTLSLPPTRGNMTRILTVRAQGSLREFVWAPGTEGAHTRLEEFNRLCARLIQQELSQ